MNKQLIKHQFLKQIKINVFGVSGFSLCVYMSCVNIILAVLVTCLC